MVMAENWDVDVFKLRVLSNVWGRYNSVCLRNNFLLHGKTMKFAVSPFNYNSKALQFSITEILRLH